MNIILESRKKANQILNDIKNLKPELDFVEAHKMAILTCEKILEAINGENQYKKELYTEASVVLQKRMLLFEEE